MSEQEKTSPPWYNDWRVWAFASLTLGLAPFTPEPHVWEKIRWIADGAGAMNAMYWFDFVLHGSPWIMLIRALVLKFKSIPK